MHPLVRSRIRVRKKHHYYLQLAESRFCNLSLKEATLQCLPNPLLETHNSSVSFFTGYASPFAQNAQRLSPQQPQQQQQQQNNPQQQQQLAYLAQQQQQQQQATDGGRSNTPFGSQSGMQSPGMQNSPQQWPSAGGAGGVGVGVGVGAGGSGAVGGARSLQQHNNPLLIAQLQVSSRDLIIVSS